MTREQLLVIATSGVQWMLQTNAKLRVWFWFPTRMHMVYTCWYMYMLASTRVLCCIRWISWAHDTAVVAQMPCHAARLRRSRGALWLAPSLNLCSVIRDRAERNKRIIQPNIINKTILTTAADDYDPTLRTGRAASRVPVCYDTRDVLGLGTKVILLVQIYSCYYECYDSYCVGYAY